MRIIHFLLSLTLVCVISTSCIEVYAQFGDYSLFVEDQLIAPFFDELQQIKKADMNNDGKIDLILCTKWTHKIGWMENDGAGNFQKLHLIDDNARYISRMAVDDIDNDGDNDIVAYFNQKLQWYPNIGEGEFAPSIVISEEAYFSDIIHIVDLDNDGNKDLLIVEDDRLYLYENEGDVSFKEAVAYEEDNFYFNDISSLKTIDLDNDGDLDFTYTRQNYFGTIINNGNNALEIKQLFEVESFQTAFLDIDKDGFLDLVCTRYGDALYWMRSNGTGEFEDPQLIDYNSSTKTAITLSDLDFDGDEDILWLGWGSNWWVGGGWNENLGDGTFGETNLIENLNGNIFIDFDGNTLPDVMNVSNWELSKQQNLGYGNFTEKQLLIHGVNARDMNIADIDNDGDMDLVYNDYSHLSWFEHQDDGTFNIQMNNIYFGSEKFYDCEVADIDKNGRMDVICSYDISDSINPGNITWFSQNENGEFTQHEIPAAENAATEIEIGDFDSDGDLDVVGSTIWGLYWFKNIGNKQFASERIVINDVSDNQNPRFNLRLGDINQDGKLEIMLMKPKIHGGHTIFWYKQNYFQNILEMELDIETSNARTFFELGDLNNDGLLDIIVISSSGGKNVTFWLENKGDAVFEEHLIGEVTGELIVNSDLLVTDMDSDEDLDIVIGGEQNETITWYENFANGTFSDRKIISDEVGAVSKLLALDTDLDGDSELIVSASEKIILFKNLANEPRIDTRVFYDENGNAQQEEHEPNLKNQALILYPQEELAFSDGKGVSSFIISPGSYQLTYEAHENWDLTTPDSVYQIKYDKNYVPTPYLFGFKANRDIFEVKPNISSGFTRCNREVPIWLNYVNTGTTVVNGTINFEVNDLPTFISASPPPDYEEDGKMYWEFEQLFPGEERKIKLLYNMPSADFASEDIVARSEVKVFNLTGKLENELKTKYFSTVLCSFDPNDKLAYTEQFENRDFVLINDSIYYTIRFQNTGNDTAFTVRVSDYLDKRLDWNTFRPLTSSHDMRTQFDRTTGAVTFQFDNILLPDMTTDEPNSHGFITYSIALIPDIGEKEKVSNTAYIYFDFNEAIVTNTTTHIVSHNPTSIDNYAVPLPLTIYPNPSHDYWQVKLQNSQNDGYILELIDFTGQVVRTYTNLQHNPILIERSGLQSGMYLLQLSDHTGKISAIGKLLLE